MNHPSPLSSFPPHLRGDPLLDPFPRVQSTWCKTRVNFAGTKQDGEEKHEGGKAEAEEEEEEQKEEEKEEEKEEAP